MTNKTSESLLMYRFKSSPMLSSFESVTMTRSARRATARAMWQSPADVEPPGNMNSFSGGSSSFN